MDYQVVRHTRRKDILSQGHLYFKFPYDQQSVLFPSEARSSGYVYVYVIYPITLWTFLNLKNGSSEIQVSFFLYISYAGIILNSLLPFVQHKDIKFHWCPSCQLVRVRYFLAHRFVLHITCAIAQAVRLSIFFRFQTLAQRS